MTDDVFRVGKFELIKARWANCWINCHPHHLNSSRSIGREMKPVTGVVKGRWWSLHMCDLWESRGDSCNDELEVKCHGRFNPFLPVVSSLTSFPFPLPQRSLSRRIFPDVARTKIFFQLLTNLSPKLTTERVEKSFEIYIFISVIKLPSKKYEKPSFGDASIDEEQATFQRNEAKASRIINAKLPAGSLGIFK